MNEKFKFKFITIEYLEINSNYFDEVFKLAAVLSMIQYNIILNVLIS